MTESADLLIDCESTAPLPGSKATSPRYRPTWYDIRTPISRRYRQTWYQTSHHPDIVIRYHSPVIIWYRSDIVVTISFRHRHYDIIPTWFYNPKRISVIIRLQYNSDIGCSDISERYRNDIGVTSAGDVEWVISTLRYQNDIDKPDIRRHRPTWYHLDIVKRYHFDVIIWCRSEIVIMISFRHRHYDIIPIWIHNR